MSDIETTRLREHYGWFQPITTRWMDNDVYGHVNNVQYYSFFDTLANTFLIQECGLDIHNGEFSAYTVHSECHYKAGVRFPDQLEGGFRINHLGNSSVQYGIGIFQNGAPLAAAFGTFTHVFVDRNSERPVPIPDAMRGPMQAMNKDRF